MDSLHPLYLQPEEIAMKGMWGDQGTHADQYPHRFRFFLLSNPDIARSDEHMQIATTTLISTKIAIV
jgi:hypothetical protein